jgi:hypothetical protein
MVAIRFERWRIRPAQAPRPWRYCSTCGAARAFDCTGRFRTNANKKSIDVWLNYRCVDCSAVWKLPIFERKTVTELPRALLEAFARHDAEIVERYAHDVGRLRSHAIRLEVEGGHLVERSEIDASIERPLGEGLQIELNVLGACDLRLDRLLASELRVSRGALAKGYEERRIAIVPAQSDPLRRRIRDGQRVWMSAQFWETRVAL